MFNPGITRHMQDLDRLKTIQAVIDREMKPGRAAEHLGLSVRQIERLVIRYGAEGPVGLISRHRNRIGNRALKASVAAQILAILSEHYADFGPTLAAEKLEMRHNIMIANGIMDPAQAASAQDPAATRTTRVPGRADTDRWLRASLVRRSCADVHGDRLRG
jgi:predicted ArsR family transcriptional regulator